MTTVNMLEAKSNLSRLVEAVESGAESEIIIARNGKPAARLVPIKTQPTGLRIGAAKLSADTVGAARTDRVKMGPKTRLETPLPDPELEAEAARLFDRPNDKRDPS